MPLWQPIVQGRREQQRLVHIRGPKALSHGRILSPNTLWKNCQVWCFRRIYSRQTPSHCCTATVTALRATSPRWPFYLPRACTGGGNLLGPALAHPKLFRQFPQRPFALLIGLQKLSSQIIRVWSCHPGGAENRHQQSTLSMKML